jgi:hypothetical protein
MGIIYEPPAKRVKTELADIEFSIGLDGNSPDEIWTDSEAVSVEAQQEITLPITHPKEQIRMESTSIPYIKVPELCNPVSQYAGWEPPCTLLTEKDALDNILVCCSAVDYARYLLSLNQRNYGRKMASTMMGWNRIFFSVNSLFTLRRITRGLM